MKARAILILSLLLLSACVTPYALVEPRRQTVQEQFTVEPGSGWNRVGRPGFEGQVELWTRDGTALNTLLFVPGIGDDQPLFARARGPAAPAGEKPPVYRRSMTALEIDELFRASVALSFDTAIVATTHLRPATLGGVDGFRFETRMLGQDEVERHGVAIGAVRDGKLYLLWFQGARLHYYERFLPEVERLFASVRFDS
jgi:hypothetical protein